MKTLLIGKLHPDAEELLQKTGLQQMENEQFYQQDSFPEVESVVLRTFTRFKKGEIEKFPQLRFVVSCSVGTDNIDLNELKQRNIELIQCPGSNANSVAEHTLYLILSLLREDVKRPFAEIKGKTIGILGFGMIGKIVAKKLLGLEAKVIAFDVIEQSPEVLKELNVEMKTMDEVLNADIITVHVPLNRYTQNLVNKESFSKMKQGVFFVNTSRAEIIEENGLIEAYQQGKFRGVGLDVYSDELKAELKEGNIILTEHVAAQGEDSFRKQCVDPVEMLLKKISE
ncbi:hypothetical protein COV20_05525 [Candidatus Woesearchaeota archaeon CG10_big_fil_rev_8_21_14_0_10_45_16]|nr:MAG: hypothetical protein COV20_05525 [Candidatus Woesearchaeota archaeon CG10_big_fil_rev_8_21_14_0_10_45_16]